MKSEKIDRIYAMLNECDMAELNQIQDTLYLKIYQTRMKEYREYIYDLWRDIANEVAEDFGLDITNGRDFDSVRMRNCLIYLIYEEFVPGCSFRAIGEAINRPAVNLGKSMRDMRGYIKGNTKIGENYRSGIEYIRSVYQDVRGKEVVEL